MKIHPTLPSLQVYPDINSLGKNIHYVINSKQAMDYFLEIADKTPTNPGVFPSSRICVWKLSSSQRASKTEKTLQHYELLHGVQTLKGQLIKEISFLNYVRIVILLQLSNKPEIRPYSEPLDFITISKPYSFNIHFNITLPFTTGSPKQSLPLSFCN
jgi:hypothetical protein